jgi:hypothetical protein
VREAGGPGSCGTGGRVEHHVEVDLVLATSIPTSVKTGYTLCLVVRGEVNFRAKKLLRLPVRSQTQSVGEIDIKHL